MNDIFSDLPERMVAAKRGVGNRKTLHSIFEISRGAQVSSL